MSIATASQRELMAETAAAMMAAFAPQLAAWGEADASEEEYSFAVGRLLLLAALFAGDVNERLNRVEMMRGVGAALGELAVSFPDLAEGFYAAVASGVHEGHESTQAALQVQGHA